MFFIYRFPVGYTPRASDFMLVRHKGQKVIGEFVLCHTEADAEEEMLRERPGFTAWRRPD